MMSLSSTASFITHASPNTAPKIGQRLIDLCGFSYLTQSQSHPTLSYSTRKVDSNQIAMWFSKSDGRPPSLPRHWPNSSPVEIEERPNRVIAVGDDQSYSFNSNFVKTSKYELYSFLPKFLMEEFNPKTKVANCYFLLIAALQCFKPISNTDGYPTTLIPLLFVVIVDGIFQVLEDISRHRADAEANASPTIRYNKETNLFEPAKWLELQVGDFVLVENRATLPADIIPLSVAEKSEIALGICYIETKSLDGETNLKIRNALPITLDKVPNVSALKKLHGTLEMEHPNKLIDSFVGVVDLGPEVGRVPIQVSNVLLRGTVLRNTDWIIGMVINTGHDTKIMMSCTATKPKTSFLETATSQEIKRIIILLALVCFTGATGEAIFDSVRSVKQSWYIAWPTNPVSFWFIQFFYYFLLHATFIPVSLYVSMSLVRSLQSYFMNNDLDMYYAATDTPALVRTMTLNEELGQISHIFSDKTGTLTCNIMDFRKASINGVSYGLGITEIGKAAWKLKGVEVPREVLMGEARAKQNSVPHVSFYCPTYEKDMQAAGNKKAKIQQFFKLLAICHDVIPEKVNGEVKFSASNPDDEALVCAADYFGFQFTGRGDGKVQLTNKEKKVEEEMELLETIPFTSKRKRMSVIIRDTDKVLRLMCKGADTLLIPRLAPNQEKLLARTNSDVDQFSQEGLRCLLIGQAEISEERYASWSVRYAKASTSIEEIEKRRTGANNDIETLEDEIEQGLVLLGATALEDRLQDGVPECIASLAEAGIRIWVLTGDKEEIAINIAVACNLLLPTSHMDHIIVNKRTCPTEASMLELFNRESEKFDMETGAVESEETSQKNSTTPANVRPRALVIDGPSLISAMDDTFIKSALLEFSNRCRAVIACRVSPDQKRALVNLVKTDRSLRTQDFDRAGNGFRHYGFFTVFHFLLELEILLKEQDFEFEQELKNGEKTEIHFLLDRNPVCVRSGLNGVPGVRTLSIGDGANDVAMIQEAHVGVGIRGEEGLQAVNASDFAIAQFRFLSVLLLKHGRFNYVRMCRVVRYMFYKNVLMSMAQFWFNFNNAWSGQKYYTEGSIQFYNLMYTSLPILLLGAYDMDIPAAAIFRHPRLYMAGINNEYFKSVSFWLMIFEALVESVILSVLPLYFLENSQKQTGVIDTFWKSGATCFTCVIFVVNFKIFLFQSRWTNYHFIAIFFSIISWFATAFFISSFTFLDYNWYNLFQQLNTNANFWLTVILLVTLILCKDFYINAWTRAFNCTPLHVVQELESLRETKVAKNFNGGHLAIKGDPMDLEIVERSWSEGSGTGIGVHPTTDGDSMVDRNGPSNLESGRSVQNVLHNGDGDIEDVTRSD